MYQTTLKQEAPASHSLTGPLQLEGSLQVLPISAQLIFPLLHSSLISKSPCPNPKLIPPFIANFLYYSLRGRVWPQSREKRKEWMLRCSKEQSSSYLGNMMFEQPPNRLFLQDSTQRTIGPLIFRSQIFLDKKWFLEATNLHLNSQSLNGKSALIWSSLRLTLNFQIFSLRTQLKSIITSCLLIILLICFYFSARMLPSYSQIFQGMLSLYSKIRWTQSACFLYNFQIYRKRRQQYFASMFENKFWLSSSNIVCRQATILCLYWPNRFSKLSLNLKCFSTFPTLSLQSSQLLTLWSQCLNAHFSLLQMNLEFPQRESQHTDTASSLCSLHFGQFLPKFKKQFIIQYNQLMGNQCCSDSHKLKSQIQQIEAGILQPISNCDYYQHAFPVEESVQLKLNYLQDHEEFRHLFDQHKVMKHKFLDKYYAGEWSDKGFPQGKGIMMQPDKYVYYGEFDRVPHGKGVVELFQEQIKYQGEISQGRAEGEGKITSKDERYAFAGIMSNSAPKTGKVFLKNHHDQSKSLTIVLEDFPNKKSEILYGDGRKYYGFINKRSFTPQGQGTAIFPDNSKYQGNWQEGEMHGQGQFIWSDGSSYKGEYQHGRKHGKGTFVFISKKYYQGQWVHGKQNGEGSLHDKFGKILHKGIWKEGVLIKQTD